MSDESDLEYFEENKEEKLDELVAELGFKAENAESKKKERRTGASKAAGFDGVITKKPLTDLLSVDDSLKSNELKHQSALLGKKKKLDKPLETPQADRIQRKVEYEKISKHVSKWDKVVQENRKAEHLVFPLDHKPLKTNTIEQRFTAQSKIGGSSRSNLEESIMSMLSGSKHCERKDNDLTIAEEEALACMTLEEARLRRSKLQRNRVLMSYHESRMKRQSKIKSKKYRRIARKRKEKQAEKEGEKNEVEVALKERALERAQLRHGAGSKWKKNKQIIAKHDAGVREMLNEQASKRNQLMTRRQQQMGDGDDKEGWIEAEGESESSDEEELLTTQQGQTANPWLSEQVDEANENDDEEEESVSETVKVDEDDIPEGSLRSWLNSSNNDEKEDEQASGVVDQKKIEVDQKKIDVDQKIEVEKKMAEALSAFKKEADEERNRKLMEAEEKRKIVVVRETKEEGLMENGDDDDGGNVVLEQVESDKKSEVVVNMKDVVEGSEHEMEDEDEGMTMAEAFADDDVVSEFRAAKRKAVEDSMPKQDDDPMDMPGWGRWDGPGIKAQSGKARRRKRKRRMMSAMTMVPAKAERRDSKIDHVILNEERNVYVTKHQVSKLPFPYTSVEQFERAMQQPVGSLWNTSSAFKSAIKPKVDTIKGAVIAPMNPETIKNKEEGRGKKRKLNSSKKEKHYKNMADSLDGVKIR